MAATKNDNKKGIVDEKQIPTNNTDTVTSSPKRKDSVYTVDEYCNNAQNLFGTRPECVRAAFVEKGVVQCEKAEAEKIVKAFIKKEVK